MQTLLFQVQGELWKLFARKRTYMGFVSFALLQVAIYILIHLKHGEEALRRAIVAQGEVFEKYLSALTLGLMITGISVFLLGALYLALVSGDIVAKEAEDGQLRLLLARPISRLRLLGIKYFACTLYAFVLIEFAAYAALALGLCVRGWGGGLFAWMLPEKGVLMNFFDAGEGFRRYVLSSALMGLGMTTVSSVGFCLSCFKIKPAAATIGCLSYVLVDFILRNSPFMENYEHLLLTKYMSTWARVYLDDIPWALILRNYSVLLAVNASLFVIGAAVFQTRDLKS